MTSHKRKSDEISVSTATRSNDIQDSDQSPSIPFSGIKVFDSDALWKLRETNKKRLTQSRKSSSIPANPPKAIIDEDENTLTETLKGSSGASSEPEKMKSEASSMKIAADLAPEDPIALKIRRLAENISANRPSVASLVKNASNKSPELETDQPPPRKRIPLTSVPRRGSFYPTRTHCEDTDQEGDKKHVSTKDWVPQYEGDADVVTRRDKQVSMGKNTLGYRRYLESVPRHTRTADDPKTPNKYLKFSRRSWDTLIKNWRKKLHFYDPSVSRDPGSADLDSHFSDILSSTSIDSMQLESGAGVFPSSELSGQTQSQGDSIIDLNPQCNYDELIQ